MLSCNEVKELLSAYYDGELGVAAQQQVAEHLAACESCREELEQLKAVSSVFHTLDFPLADKAFSACLHERLEEEAKKNKPHWFGAMLKDMRTYATVAACLVLTVGIYAAVNNHSLKPVPLPQNTPIVTDRGVAKAQPSAAPDAGTAQKPTVPGETGGTNENKVADNRAGEPRKPAQTPVAPAGDRQNGGAGNGQETPNVLPQATPTPDTAGHVVPGSTEQPRGTQIPRIEHPDNNAGGEDTSPASNTTDPSQHSGGAGSGGDSGLLTTNPTGASSSTSFVLTDAEKRDYVLEVLARFGTVTVSDTEAQAKVLSSNYAACLSTLRSVDGLQESDSFTAEGESDGYCYVRIALK